ncbi:unnamed protein product [Darwinula stevensoni]|uniref:Gustatory receptor n=1 Tax=Darwinula stevensoni TaxID=69355 RepID=A0A7R9FPK8_9CRUS|nr:unnamed protein product [Darwinula stevensoni]CAG0898138.1 unnamed protein product [Darwinula stevensoni]
MKGGAPKQQDGRDGQEIQSTPVTMEGSAKDLLSVLALAGFGAFFPPGWISGWGRLYCLLLILVDLSLLGLQAQMAYDQFKLQDALMGLMTSGLDLSFCIVLFALAVLDARMQWRFPVLLGLLDALEKAPIPQPPFCANPESSLGHATHLEAPFPTCTKQGLMVSQRELRKFLALIVSLGFVLYTFVFVFHIIDANQNRGWSILAMVAYVHTYVRFTCFPDIFFIYGCRLSTLSLRTVNSSLRNLKLPSREAHEGSKEILKRFDAVKAFVLEVSDLFTGYRLLNTLFLIVFVTLALFKQLDDAYGYAFHSSLSRVLFGLLMLHAVTSFAQEVNLELEIFVSEYQIQPVEFTAGTVFKVDRSLFTSGGDERWSIETCGRHKGRSNIQSLPVTMEGSAKDLLMKALTVAGFGAFFPLGCINGWGRLYCLLLTLVDVSLNGLTMSMLYLQFQVQDGFGMMIRGLELGFVVVIFALVLVDARMQWRFPALLEHLTVLEHVPPTSFQPLTNPGNSPCQVTTLGSPLRKCTRWNLKPSQARLHKFFALAFLIGFILYGMIFTGFFMSGYQYAKSLGWYSISLLAYIHANVRFTCIPDMFFVYACRLSTLSLQRVNFSLKNLDLPSQETHLEIQQVLKRFDQVKAFVRDVSDLFTGYRLLNTLFLVLFVTLEFFEEFIGLHPGNTFYASFSQILLGLIILFAVTSLAQEVQREFQVFVSEYEIQPVEFTAGSFFQVDRSLFTSVSNFPLSILIRFPVKEAAFSLEIVATVGTYLMVLLQFR